MPHTQREHDKAEYQPLRKSTGEITWATRGHSASLGRFGRMGVLFDVDVWALFGRPGVSSLNDHPFSTAACSWMVPNASRHTVAEYQIATARAAIYCDLDPR